MEKVRPWRGQLSDRGRLMNRTEQHLQIRAIWSDDQMLRLIFWILGQQIGRKERRYRGNFFAVD